MRHPSLQCDNRIAELLPKLKYWTATLRGRLVEESNAEEELEKKRKAVWEARDKYKEILAIMDRLSIAERLWPWGLPENISIAEFESIAGENNSAFSAADREAEAERLRS